MSGVTSEPAHLGVWVETGFDVGVTELATELDARLDRSVTVTEATEATDSLAGVVVFADDPDTVERRLHQARSTPVVATTNPNVARIVGRHQSSVPVVEWNHEDPPWAFLESKLAAVTLEANEETRHVEPTDGIGSEEDEEAVESVVETTVADDEPAIPPAESLDTSSDPASTLASYEQLMDSMGDAVYVLDETGHFVYVNDAMLELTDHDREEIIGAPPAVIKDKDAVIEAENALGEMLSSEGPSWASIELEITTADGSRVPVEDHMTLLPYDECLRGTVGVLRDITTQKRREEMFSGLLEASRRMMEQNSAVAIAGIAVETAEQTLNQDLTTVRLRQDDRLVPVATAESTRAAMPQRPAYDLGEGAVGEAFTEQQTVERRPEEIDDDRDRGEVDTALYVPLGEEGTITVGSRHGEFDEQDRRFVELLSATTQRALGRADRERSLRRYRALVEEIDGLAFAVDEREEFALLTDPFADAVGYDRETLVGSGVDLIDTGVLEKALDEVSVQKGDGSAPETVVKEGALRTSDGGKLPVQVRASPVSTDAFDGTVVAANDITELRSAQEAAKRTQDRFGGLFDALTDPVAELVVPDGAEPSDAELQRSNETFDEQFDESRVGVATGTVGDLSVPDDVADHLVGAARRAQSSEEGGRAELTLQVSGQRRHFVVRDVPYEIDDTVHSFVIFTEVTALKRRETQTAVLTRILRHNLRNEISVVSGFVDQVERNAGSEDVRSAAERIQEAADHLISLSETSGVIQDILEDDTERHQPLDLGSAIDKAVSQTLSRNPDATVKLDTDAAGTIDATEYLEHAIKELVDNAVTHNPRDDPTVRVSVDHDDEATTVVVGDNGPPIPEVEWNVVTDQQEITQLTHGSGIGLWLVRWVVDANGGSLNLLKNDDEGTKVAVTLPHTGTQSAAVAERDRWSVTDSE